MERVSAGAQPGKSDRDEPANRRLGRQAAGCRNGVIAWYVIVPLALASVLTGLVMSLGTKWGLFRHNWVMISLVLTIIVTAVLLVETQTISYFADVAADPTTSADDLRALGNTLVHSVGGTVVLLVILVLNVYKPRGMTHYGWRKQQDKTQAKSVLQNAA